ncbi:titin homolog [Bicyclus anynana]|uniref:Titin homolog n=1 Tax=Bicyclus anynana TaxID=110368 RepID=A0A6J1MQN7_BICAN|nr:titin homolog [Bicyclus anynana]
MEIEVPLRDIVTDEYTSIVFECKVSDCSRRCISYKWYKDGKQIEATRRIKISYDGKWHRLEITSVITQDYGIYIILLNNNGKEIFSKANLYVREIKDMQNNDVIYISPKSWCFNASRHLRCTKVLVGNIIELEATFNAESSDEYVWYKSNRPLLPNERTIVLNDKKTTTLSILCAKETDTGIYHVVCNSEYGIASSFANVIVLNTDLDTINSSEVVPSIDEPLQEELEINEGEDVRLMCKITYDVNTVIHWCKNGITLEKQDNKVTEYYNNRYTCLRIKSASVKDGGEYSILMRDEITGHTDTSSCFLTVNHSQPDKLSSVKLRTPLLPVVTCIGSKLSLTCSFFLDDPKFYYVVWYIGHYRVERTNHRFNVVSSGGDFFLFIKQIKPGMAGEVTCELRKSLPNRTSVLINCTSTVLTIVPPAVLNNITKLNMTSKNNIYCNGNFKINIPFKNKKHALNGIQKPILSTNDTNICREELVITYCRLDDDNFYFEITNNENEESNPDYSITIYENCTNEKHPTSKVVIMEWFNTMEKNTDVNEPKLKWYKIEYGKVRDHFVEAGVSSLAMLEIKDPPLEQIIKFRISVTDSKHQADESRVCIMPAIEDSYRMNKQCEIKPMEEFNLIFTKTGDLIGCGAFGSVVLVCDKVGEFYAAKILKTRTQKKRDTAMREYELLKILRHPKLVELHSAFTAKESFILVMDYLWGGELFDRIVEEEHIKELDVVPYVRQICEALQYLHSNKIVHLDLKPENIICLSPNSRQVKIIDFGLARVLDATHVRAIYGTRDYVAPEVLNFEQLTLACDMWSLGVVTYMLLSGVMPFSGDSWPERSANITKANYNYHESAFKDISDLAKNFVDHLLILQPERRMTAGDALNHRWIIEGPPKGAKSAYMKRTRQNLKSYLANNRARWQRAGNVMIAAHRLRNAGSQRNTLDADRVSPSPTRV